MTQRLENLPANVEAEQLVLGSILLDDSLFAVVDASLAPDDFLLTKHRRMFERMRDLNARAERIEYVTLADELDKHGQLESVESIAVLTDGMPRLQSIDSYVKLVKDKSLLRRMLHATQVIAGQCLESTDTVDEILAEAETLVLQIGDAQLRSGLASPKEIISASEGGAQTFLDPSKRVKGLSSPYIKLEEMTTGMHGGELIILAARPAMGKTALALNIAQHIAAERDGEPGRTVALFSLEMSRDQLLTRILCAEARVDQHRFRLGYLNDDEKRRLRAALHAVTQSRLYIDDTASASVSEVSAKCRRLRAEQGLALVVIDYLQLMGSKGKTENRVQEISTISRGLKLLAKDLDVPVLALSQLSRAPEQRQGDHRPLLSDLRESGSIEQDADRVMFIFREEIYKPDREDLQGIAELIIAKQRNGPTGKIRLAFLHKFAKFENLAEAAGGRPADDDAPFDD